MPSCFTPASVYSKHNFDDGENYWGLGGYRVVKLESGVFKIIGKTNKAKSLHSAAAQLMWQDKALEICGDNYHIEKDTHAYHIKHYVYLDWDEYQNVKEGLAVCIDTAQTYDSVKDITSAVPNSLISAVNAKVLLTGNTISGVTDSGTKYDIYLNSNGKTYGQTNRGSEDSGIWYINSEEQCCRKWKRWAQRKFECWYIVSLEDNKFQMRENISDKPHSGYFEILKGDTKRLDHGL